MTSLADLAARVRYVRAAYGTRPWRAELNGVTLSAPPRVIDHPDLGRTVVMGARCFKTRREAQAAIAALFASLERSS